jgi:hypothetical protein
MNNINNEIEYSNGKIYKIVCNITGQIYVGSTTTLYLSRRLSQHKKDYSKYLLGTRNAKATSFKVLENGNCNIVLLENVPYSDINELRARERFYIETLECVNKNIPSRTLKEWTKTYYHKNKEKILENKKEYRINNKEKLDEKKKEKFTCECGGKYTRSGKSHHEKSQKHKKYLSEVVEIFV